MKENIGNAAYLTCYGIRPIMPFDDNDDLEKVVIFYLNHISDANSTHPLIKYTGMLIEQFPEYYKEYSETNIKFIDYFQPKNFAYFLKNKLKKS